MQNLYYDTFKANIAENYIEFKLRLTKNQYIKAKLWFIFIKSRYFFTSNYSEATYNEKSQKSPKDYAMARKCSVTGKGPLVGNNVSHANNKTKRRQLPNLRTLRVTLEDGTTTKVKVAASTLRTMRKRAAKATSEAVQTETQATIEG